MTINFTQLVAALENLLQEDGASVDSDFAAIIPQIIDDAEQRIYRELNFLAQRQENTSLTSTPGSRTISLSATSLPCMVVEQLALFTPQASGTAGTRQIFQGPVSLDFVNTFWPTAGSTSAPGTVQGYWAMQDNQTVVVAPTPDTSYTVGVTGVFRPLPMSASNVTTYLGTYYPDLYLSACMVFGCAYQRDFSAVNADNAMASTWEKHYQDEKKSVIDEEARRRGEAPGWTPMMQYEGVPPRT